MTPKPVIVIPIYKPDLTALERYSLDVSVAALPGRTLLFIGPHGLALDYYRQNFPAIPFRPYDTQSFASIQGYNRLLLSPAFYEGFTGHTHMLVLQTDAVVLRDELDYWCSQPFDYVGAPWPEGNELFVNLGRFAGPNGKRLRVHVGNGGLSLRRIYKCIKLLHEFADATTVFSQTGSSEDLFFAFMGALSHDFVLPNEITASRFALELKAAYYYEVNGGVTPMGGHAWWKYDLPFWRSLLPAFPSLDVQPG